MFKKISIIASLIFFLLGPSVCSQSHIEAASSNATSKKLIQTGNNNNNTSMNAYILPGTVGILFIIGISSYWLIYRRKTLKKEV
jgi:hypothetical protein